MVTRREPISLFGEILDWMLAPLLLAWPISVALTLFVAQTVANRPYDRGLGDLALAVARQVVVQLEARERTPQEARAEMERTVASLVHGDNEDLLFFQVLGGRGQLVAGDSRLAVPQPPLVARTTVAFRDDMIGEEAVRVAYLRLDPGAGSAASGGLVQVAETLNKRSRLATEFIKGVILPQFVILPLAVTLVWMALSRGIRPLNELQRLIRRRESSDISPIPEDDVPEEVAPLVRAINDLLLRLDRSIANQRHFLADAAHQLKTPLAGLRMQAELAAREIDSGRGDPASMKHSLVQIALSSQRAAHLVNQLLAMARAEDTGQLIRRQPTDLASVTRDVVRDFVPLALEQEIDLGYEGPEPARPQAEAAGVLLLAEPVLLGELVRNLVDNALRYTPRGGSVTVRVLPDPFGQVVVLQVEDTGPGIAPAERERVFQPFYRALGTEAEGSGLGLAIVQEIAQRHGASVTVGDARPRTGLTAAGAGALFTVRFVLSAAAAPTTAATSAATATPPAPEPGRGG